MTITMFVQHKQLESSSMTSLQKAQLSISTLYFFTVISKSDQKKQKETLTANITNIDNLGLVTIKFNHNI